MGKSARYGALGATFKISRILQSVSLIAIIGMTANFISEMVNAKVTPPSVLVGILSIVRVIKLLELWRLILARSALLCCIVPSLPFSSLTTDYLS